VGKDRKIASCDSLPLVTTEQKLAHIARSLASHYNTESCIIAVTGDDTRSRSKECRILARHGDCVHLECCNNTVARSGFRFFHHHLARSLPTIVVDSKQNQMLKDHPMVVEAPHIRFYAAAPLVTDAEAFVGTVSIFDRRPRERFTLQDGEELQRCAQEVVQIIGSSDLG